MHIFLNRLGAAFFLFLPMLGFSSEPPAATESLTVSTAWLAEHLRDANLVLLHVGDKGDYDAKHIPGARYVSLDDISVSDHTGKGLMLEMPTADDLHKRLAALGINDESRIVVYFAKDWVSPATRAIFTLDTAGLGPRSALLDGGLTAWLHEKRETTKAPPAAATGGTLAALQMQPRIVDATFVQAHLHTPDYVVIDGRAAAYYDGIDTGMGHRGPHKTGHVAGAQNLPFSTVTTTDLKLKSPDELRAMFDKIGVKQDDTVIGYCHIGQQATEMLFAARSLGHKVLLYDGSFEDWSNRDLPVENPAKKAAAK
ncbi:sulfurtransferase [Pseudolysobacter antarcticus]|uniref:Sulfurtransferase n=1 Tax=Pseudolysobacter antarcticus TaxID=2511995 RepID=A0A411HKZ5_9GAMM|nr:rhodanese-like domain-containing protein [Pseudolysobacter antarcticus]QBB71084.1 sulfurtransferase [Pseudolysobacter antarcticus]